MKAVASYYDKEGKHIEDVKYNDGRCTPESFKYNLKYERHPRNWFCVYIKLRGRIRRIINE